MAGPGPDSGWAHLHGAGSSSITGRGGYGEARVNFGMALAPQASL